jgi:hypothetical protein
MRIFFSLFATTLLVAQLSVAHAKETGATLQVSAVVVAPSTTMSVALPVEIGGGKQTIVCLEGVCPKAEISRIKMSDGKEMVLLTLSY